MICIHYVFCSAGLVLAIAYDDLSNGKVASESPTKVSPIYEATLAIDRDAKTCMRTDPLGINAPAKKTWWKVDLLKVSNIYSISILFKNYDAVEEPRQRGRFAGFSLYLSEVNVTDSHGIKGSTLCYKDGPQLPPLNFTAVCTGFGRYVIYYNERLDEVIYPKGYERASVFTELCEVIIKGCRESSVYGDECNSPCPINCKDSICHIKRGYCFACKPGWTGQSCDIKCNEKWYGVNCTQQCLGHCKSGATCNHVTGRCDVECDAGWTGTFCDQECDDGKYGFNCVNNCSGHCLNKSPCNKQNGQCDGGCDFGYTASDCSNECLYGNYGMDCTKHCSGNCINNEHCDHVNGVCTSGCKDGYIGAHCFVSCSQYNYGRNCSYVCSSNCKTCRHTDGHCTCKAGWMGSNCTTECTLSYGENCQYPCSIHCINKVCDRFNGTCLFGCKNGDACNQGITEAVLDDLPQSVGGTIGACVVLIIGTVFAVFFIRFKRKATKMAKRESIVYDSKQHTLMEPMTRTLNLSVCKEEMDQTNTTLETTIALPEKTKRGPPTNKNISIRNIKAQITNMSANENTGIKNEYHDIPRGELHESLEAKTPKNKAKNRYTTIYPYDHSRVVLKKLAAIDGDYINANYIEETQGKRIYIATQGPKPKTIADFWSMLWQEEVSNIVCLTNLKEGTKNKCVRYWPDINDKLQGGTLTIRHLEEKTYAEYIVRRFKIHNKTTRTDRNVTMYHYTTWPDHGVADPLSLVVFHRHVIRATANCAGKYTVVHCSAGVGRTGTYIALDALYREGERTGKINVPMYVRTMRKDRMNMIQGDEQYKLLYLALMEAFGGPSRCMTTEKFVGACKEQSCYANCGDVVQNSSQSSEFEELLSLRKEYTQQDYTSGRAHTSANYTRSVLPVEEFMCHLSYIKGHNTYYNAVLLQSYLEKDSLISAQFPLQDNTEDFLRLIKDFDARVVIFLCPLKDIESTPAWFPTDNQSKLNGLFFIKNISSTKASNVQITKLNIQPQGFSEMNITVIECPTWRKGKGTADKRVLLDVIKAVKTEKSDQEGRIIVMSSDGATRCGPFFVVYNVLEQISVDREVDIFTATRHLQVRRPEFVSTLEEYQLCHDAVAEYLLNDCVYGNC